MSTNTKLYIGIGFLMVVVFGATIIRQAVPDSPPPPPAFGDETGTTEQAGGELLRAEVEHLRYDPRSDKAVYREYPEFFERNDHPVPIWFCNPNPEPVKLTFLHTSCGACSFADVAVVPTPKVDPAAPPDPFGAIIGGVMGRSALSSDDPGAFGLDAASHAERAKLLAAVPSDKWQRIVAANSTAPGIGDPGKGIDFPAGSPDKPTWGVLRLNIKVNESKTLEATIGQQRASAKIATLVTYTAKVTLAPVCEVEPTQIAAGELAEGGEPYRQTVYYFSSTRTTDPNAPPDQQLPKPVVGGLKNDPFLTVGPAEPLTDAERRLLADQLTTRRQGPVRVIGGYKMALTLSRTAPDPADPKKVREMDLGPAERRVTVAPESGAADVRTVTVTSVGVGSVTVDGTKVRNGVIDLGSFAARDGTGTTVRVSTDRPGVELEAVPDQHRPSFLNVPPLGPPETKNGRTSWTVRVDVPPGQGGGRLGADSVIALRIKSTGQMIRLPVAGNGQN